MERYEYSRSSNMAYWYYFSAYCTYSESKMSPKRFQFVVYLNLQILGPNNGGKGSEIIDFCI